MALLASAWVAPTARAQQAEDQFRAARNAMVDLIARYGVRDSATLDAMRSIPRHLFVPPARRYLAYGDYPLPIAHGQTISQPYIVAYMTEVLHVRPGMKVLEVGTGSGYQAAVLAEIGATVFTVEIVEGLADSARALLRRLGYANVTVRHGDGYIGWEEEAPFDAVIVTAAPDHLPPALPTQLKPGGRMVIPVGAQNSIQYLLLLEKDSDGTVSSRRLLPVRFVPLIRQPG